MRVCVCVSNILVGANLQHVYTMTEAVQAVAVTRCGW